MFSTNFSVIKMCILLLKKKKKNGTEWSGGGKAIENPGLIL